MIEMREKEIMNGLRAAPGKKPKRTARPFADVFAKHMAWGGAQKGKAGLAGGRR